MEFKKIVVPLDGSEFAESVLPHLRTLTASCASVEAELVSVVQPLEMHYRAAVPLDSREEKQINQAEIKAAEEYLEGVKSRLDVPNLKVTTRVLSGKPAEALAAYLEGGAHDLLLMATHGRSGPSRWVLGSVADRLVQISPIPVLLVRPMTPHAAPRAQDK
jgi:nucleotide-binding universal stress UspA family protein